MKMLMTVPDRLVALSISRDGAIEANISTWREIGRFQDEVGFTDAENKVLKFEDIPGGGLQWQENAVGPREFEVSGTVRKAIGRMLEHLNENEKLKKIHLSVYALFCDDGDKPELVK